MLDEIHDIEPHKILIVDDEPDLQVLIRQRFRRSIRSGEFEFFFALNGLEALQQLREHSDIEVVLTDINMPQMDGLTLLNELKTLNNSGHCAKAVVVSAYGDLDNIRTAMNRGAFDFLMKPIDFGDVEITINKTLEYVAQGRESRRAEEYRIARNVAETNYSQLKELEKLRDSLTHMIVHDLRTPLTAVLGGLHTVPALGDLTPLQQEFLEIATLSSETLLGMINDLLSISKMESGALKIIRREVQVHELARRAVEQVRFLARGKEIDLQHELTEELPVLHAEEEMLSRVLVNLIGNAIKFTPEEGQVWLGVQHDVQKNEMVFTIKDTGQGIPAEEFERIFDKFGQVDGGTGTRTSTGLGLTFCKMAVEAHGGHIWVESTLGEGSAFFFTIPLQELS
ncbi:adaptive-response sensory-kinase SasA [Abditibacteriota bacterium]|nr:adaptive-response sensory-kinase SasA [Abditibacteriota bacterium]